MFVDHFEMDNNIHVYYNLLLEINSHFFKSQNYFIFYR
jgi:hypothetical protein